MEDSHLIIFKKISNFVSDLANVYQEKQKSLALYNRLLEKTTLSHDAVIKKHVECFSNFCSVNRDSIMEQDLSKMTEAMIRYSDKVFIDVKNLISISDKDTKDAIWNHLLIILNAVDPACNAKNILKERIKKGPDSQEEKFIENLITKVESTLDPTKLENPMDAISSIMSSGLITDIIGGVQKGINDGSLDIGKLMGTMNGLINKSGMESPLPMDINMISSMMSSMMGNMNLNPDGPK